MSAGPVRTSRPSPSIPVTGPAATPEAPKAAPPAATPAPAAAEAPATRAAPPADAGRIREGARLQADVTRQAWMAKGGGGDPAPTTNAPAAAPTPGVGTTPPPLPAGTYDVATITPDQLHDLQQSRSPGDRAMASTIQRAQHAYADRIASGARVLVNTSPGNGGRPVLTMIPPGFDYSRPATVQTHYHGWNATVADNKGHGAGLSFRMEEIQRQNPQAVFVLPECGNAKAGAYHTDWSNVRSQADTTNDALGAAGITNVGARVVSAHSGGGAALQRAIDRHPDGSGLQADRLEMLDCLYGSQGSIARWARTPNGQACNDAVYYHGTNDTHASDGLHHAFGDHYRRVNVSAPHPVPTGVTPDGRTVPRFNADAHNRTVGEFLGS